mgnify:CR=1 FL=1
MLAVVINGQISNTATVSTCAVPPRTLDGVVVGPPTIIALDPSRCKKDATEAATAAGEATIYYEKAYDSTDAGGTELDLIQKSDMPYEIIIGPNSDSPMSVRISDRPSVLPFCPNQTEQVNQSSVFQTETEQNRKGHKNLYLNCRSNRQTILS